MKRKDSRRPNQMRPVKFTRSFSKFAEGSCLIELGNTKVICTASVEESVPPFLRNSGTGWVTAEYGMLPRSCSTRIPRNKDSGRTFEIQRLVGRSLRAVTNLKAFGERSIWVDCDVIQGDGGTRTAAITGSFVALGECFAKLKDDGIIDKIPLKEFVAATSVGIVNGQSVLDLAYEEDSRADVDMNVVMTSSQKFIEIQGTGERTTFDVEQMDALLRLAKKGIEELIDLQKAALKDVL